MENTLIIEICLSRAFAEVYDISRAWYPKNDVLGTAMCKDAKEACTDIARQNLGIEVVTINGIQYWRWPSNESPEYVWEVLCNEINERGGY